MLRGTISRGRVDWKSCATILLICFLLPGFLRAQAPQPPVPPPATQESAAPRLPQEALNQLLAPIALYPDPLVALILPASTTPSDLVLAARYLSSSGDPAQITNQPWDDSVKSLARYPDVLKWMDQNLEWTTQVGDAFLNQPADVMNTIQQLRAQAIAAGTLVDCPQQRIVKEESCIRIVPAEPDLIYVPQYDPEVVYAQPYEPYGAYLGPALTFGIGFAVGSWLNYDCDWPRRRVCVGDWNPRWRDDWYPGWKNGWNPGWKQKWKRKGGGEYAANVVNITGESARAWQPSEKIRRQNWNRQGNFENNATALNAIGRRGGPGDPVQRFATVARPSRLNFNGQGGRGARRSDSGASSLSRNLPGDGQGPGSLPGSQSIQAEQGSRGNGNREVKGRGRAKQQSDSPAVTTQQAAESFSAGGNSGKADNLKGRKGRADSGSVGSGQSSRSKSSGSVRSKSNGSSQQFKTGRSKSSQSGNTAQSFSKANKHSQGAGGGGKGGSKRQATAPKQDKAQFGGGGNKGGGGSKSGQKGGKGKGKGKD